MKNPFEAGAFLSDAANPSISSNPIPGLHIVANLAATRERLFHFDPFRDFIRRQIEENNLQDVGSVYHNFDSGGFTAVVCLTESHLSIHTWPEHNYLTFDIFLSNYLKDNRALTYKMYESVKSHFDATVLFEQVIQR